jgi:hypothetical protein
MAGARVAGWQAGRRGCIVTNVMQTWQCFRPGTAPGCLHSEFQCSLRSMSAHLVHGTASGGAGGGAGNWISVGPAGAGACVDVPDVADAVDGAVDGTVDGGADSSAGGRADLAPGTPPPMPLRSDGISCSCRACANVCGAGGSEDVGLKGSMSMLLGDAAAGEAVAMTGPSRLDRRPMKPAGATGSSPEFPWGLLQGGQMQV